MMKRYSSWIFIFILIFHNSGFSQDSTKFLTIKQCVDLAIKNNLLVQQSQITLETNGVTFKQAKDNLLPQISGTVSQGNNYGRSVNSTNNTYVDQQNSSGSYSLNGNLLLFNGLQLQNAIKQNALFYHASKMDLQQQKDNITLLVLNAYLTVLSSQEALGIANKQASVDSAQVARLAIQNEQGAIPPATLSDLQGQYASDEVTVVNAINALETAKVTLFSYLNVPYQKDAVYEMVNMNADISDLNGSSDSIYQAALQTIPTIKANDLRVQSFQKSIAVARGKMWPSLYFYGNLNSNYTSIATNTIANSLPTPGNTGEFVTIGPNTYDVQANSYPTEKTAFVDQVKNNRFQSIGLQLNIPILNYLSLRNNVKIAKLNYENAKIISTSSHYQLQQMVE
ncbi:MAG TPA: TolC family protein, partial [Puia sp.]|nr:TolC family protein [Puia sp.]